MNTDPATRKEFLKKSAVPAGGGFFFFGITILKRRPDPTSNRSLLGHGELQLLVQQETVYRHCHDVCIDEDKSVYVCQWNAGRTYPMKPERV